MKNRVKWAALGLCVGVGTLGAPSPASADVFWNLKAEETNPSSSQQMCMGISGGDPGGHVKVGTPIIVWNCNYSSDQAWSDIRLGADTLAEELEDTATDPFGNSVCLYDRSGQNDQGTQLTVADCNEGLGEQFFKLLVAYDSEGYPCYTIQNNASKRYIGVANAQANPVQDGMAVIMWTRTPSDDQVWCEHPDPTIIVP